MKVLDHFAKELSQEILLAQKLRDMGWRAK